MCLCSENFLFLALLIFSSLFLGGWRGAGTFNSYSPKTIWPISVKFAQVQEKFTININLSGNPIVLKDYCLESHVRAFTPHIFLVVTFEGNRIKESPNTFFNLRILTSRKGANFQNI